MPVPTVLTSKVYEASLRMAQLSGMAEDRGENRVEVERSPAQGVRTSPTACWKASERSDASLSRGTQRV